MPFSPQDIPPPPDCAVVTIGTELLLGQIVDTNAGYLSRALAEAGLRVRRRMTVGDELQDIVDVLERSLHSCGLVVTTGGLGPTLDDLTREAVAGVAGVPLEFRQDLMTDIEAVFKRYGYRMADNNRRQAFVPRGATAIPNPVGTAPGFICRIGEKAVVCLPGVPRELKYLFPREVLPWARRFFGLSEQVLLYRTLKTVGIGESQVDSLIGDLIRPGANPEVGLLASDGEIKIRIAARDENRKKTLETIAPLEDEIRSRLGRRIYGTDAETLEGVLAGLLASQTLSILESFSGGLAVSKLLRTEQVPLRQGMVIPGEQELLEWAGTAERPLLEDPAFQERLARAFVSRTRSDLALLILGFPNPHADTWQVEAHSIVASAEGVLKRFAWQMGGEYQMLRYRGAITGLNTLRLALLERPPVPPSDA